MHANIKSKSNFKIYILETILLQDLFLLQDFLRVANSSVLGMFGTMNHSHTIQLLNLVAQLPNQCLNRLGRFEGAKFATLRQEQLMQVRGNLVEFLTINSISINPV